MKCDTCKTKEAMIHAEGVGDLFLDCHNDLMAELLGTKQLDGYSKEISIYDVDGTVHKFEVWNMLLPIYSIWHADEIDGGYQFEVMTGLEDDQLTALQHLHQKILTGVGYKTLQVFEEDCYVDNALRYGHKQFGIKNVGTGRIEYREDESGVCMIIDGIEVDLQDFGKMLTTFEGYNFEYQIQDKSDEVLGKDMVLRQVNIRPEVILAHFETTLGWFLENDFLSYKYQSDCEEALRERVDELELLYKYGDMDKAMKLGEQVKKRLLSISHDTEDFPESLIEDINRVLEISD